MRLTQILSAVNKHFAPTELECREKYSHTSKDTIMKNRKKKNEKEIKS